MRLYLSALGWISDAPAGNRLRWYYPTTHIHDGRYLGLPTTMIVERAWLDEDIPQTHLNDEKLTASGNTALPMAPYSWWDNMGDVSPEGFLPQIFRLPYPVQAVHFQYQGGNTRLIALNSEGKAVADREIVNGQLVILKAPDISVLIVFTNGVIFRNLKTLDLFHDRRLKWEEIAHIQVADTVYYSLQETSLRYDQPTTLNGQQWLELVDVAGNAQSSDPVSDAISSGEPTAWEAFQMMIGTRWEHAVLFGHGFFDGPRSNWPDIDDIRKDHILPEIPPRAVAYRVREERGRLGPSNIAVCPPWLAAPLIAPSVPAYESPEVKLTSEVETGKPKFVATYRLRWTVPDPLVLGVEIQEEISPSPTPTIASSSVDLDYSCRTRQPDDPPGQGVLVRSQDVAFHDVELRCRARSVDGWDRSSPFTAYTLWTQLALKHSPPPPNLTSAIWSSGSVSLRRQVGDPNFPDWTPDLVVQHDPHARLLVYRRKTGAAGQPAAASVTIGTPVLVSGNLYRAQVAGLASLTPFEHGKFVVKAFQARIQRVSGMDIYFEVGQGYTEVFDAGTAELLQDPLYQDLWDEVGVFNLHGLPTTLTLADPVAGPGETADILSYHTRIAFLGTRIGPASNTVQAIRRPAIPVKPPPFSAELLGVDFYNRTMVKIRFTNPTNSGTYTIWWANGTPVDFAAEAVPGEMRAQKPYNGRFLFDVLAIPLPQAVSRTITLGVQRVTAGEGQSSFETVPVTLIA